jgi:regulatory protein
MDIQIDQHPQDPELLALKVNNTIYKILPKQLFIRRLSALRGCQSMQELQEYIEKTEEEGAFRLVLRMLARRGYFASELRTRLRERGFPAFATEKAITRCLERGYIDDNLLRERVIASEVRKGRGPRYIAAKLKNRDPKLAHAAGLDEIDQKPGIEALIAKLSKKYDLKTQGGKGKLFQALQRRGFDTEAILSCMRSGL